MKRYLSLFLSAVLKFVPQSVVYAHCDVPCGIYDPKPAQIAAATVLKMVQKIKELPTDATGDEMLAARNSFVRMVWTKEEHARRCKEELLILWTDYFKEEHKAAFPDLHEKFWKAAKLCSKNKQSVDETSAKDLVSVVDEIAAMFAKAEEAKKKS